MKNVEARPSFCKYVQKAKEFGEVHLHTADWSCGALWSESFALILWHRWSMSLDRTIWFLERQLRVARKPMRDCIEILRTQFLMTHPWRSWSWTAGPVSGCNTMSKMRRALLKKERLRADRTDATARATQWGKTNESSRVLFMSRGPWKTSDRCYMNLNPLWSLNSPWSVENQGSFSYRYRWTLSFSKTFDFEIRDGPAEETSEYMWMRRWSFLLLQKWRA